MRKRENKMKALSVGSISIGPTVVVGGGIFLILLIGAIFGLTFWKNNRSSKVLTEPFSEPLNGAMMAKVDISTSSGNLTVGRLAGSEEVLANGTLQYLENQSLPERIVTRSNGQATFTLKASGKGQPWFRLPWQTCNGATEWRIQLNPSVPSDISVYSGGGNVELNLAGLEVTRVSADTGGGNMAISLPDNTKNLTLMARTGGGNVNVEMGYRTTGQNSMDVHSGAGNVVVRLTGGIAAHIIATSGMGKVIVDSSFVKLDEKTYQSPDYEQAADKIEITLHSGAGNVIVNTR
jgi:hypothetical protein